MQHASATTASSTPGVRSNAPMLPRTNSRVFCAACCFRNSAASPDASPYRPCTRHLVGAHVLALLPQADELCHRLRLLLCHLELNPICTRPSVAVVNSPRGCPNPPHGSRPACRLSSGPAIAPAPPGSAARAASTGWAPHMLCAMPNLQVSSCIQMRRWHRRNAGHATTASHAETLTASHRRCARQQRGRPVGRSNARPGSIAAHHLVSGLGTAASGLQGTSRFQRSYGYTWVCIGVDCCLVLC